jgi:hypothetical protein
MGRRHIDAVASDTSTLLAEDFRSLYNAAKSANRRPHLLLREYQERIAFEIRYLKKSREKREVRFRRASSKIPGLSKRIHAALREALVSSHVPTSRREQAEQKLPGADDVFHEAVIECARYVWKNPSLMYHVSPEERRVRNQATVALAFRDIVHNVIRDAIPDDEFDEFDSDSEGEETTAAGGAEGREEERGEKSGEDRRAEDAADREPGGRGEEDTKSDESGEDAKSEVCGEDAKPDESGEDTKSEVCGEETKSEVCGEETKSEVCGEET